VPNRTAYANGADPVQQKASADANAIQDAVNFVAVVDCFHRHLLAPYIAPASAVTISSTTQSRSPS
jgi:hypothetical protein